jgi:hypothetical protein
MLFLFTVHGTLLCGWWLYIQLIETAIVCIVGSLTVGWAFCVNVWREFPSNLYHVDKSFKTHRSQCWYTLLAQGWIQQPPLPVHILHNCSSHWATHCCLQQWFESPLDLITFCLIVIQISHQQQCYITNSIKRNYTDHCKNTPILPTYQHCTSVVCKYGNKLALILLTTVTAICKMVKTKTSKAASRRDN